MDEARFLRGVAEQLEVDKQGAQVITFAVLQVLRSRLTAKQASHIDAQLPIHLKSFHPLNGTEPRANRFNKDEFLRRVRLLSGLSEETTPRAANVVFKMLQAALQSPTGHEGEGWGIFSQLPKDLKKLWCEASRVVN